ncbi:hypothetical protein ACJX0J_012601 [Zea mays]
MDSLWHYKFAKFTFLILSNKENHALYCLSTFLMITFQHLRICISHIFQIFHIDLARIWLLCAFCQYMGYVLDIFLHFTDMFFLLRRGRVASRGNIWIMSIPNKSITHFIFTLLFYQLQEA